MPNLMLTWSQAAVVGALLLVAALALTAAPIGDRGRQRRARQIAPFAREAAVIAGLYSAWQFAGNWSANGITGAFARARWIDRTERHLHVISESRLEQPLLHHAWLGQAANVYYATMHFTGLFVLLVWMFVRHRDNYARVRTTVAVFTAVCLLIQLMPVAPPRLLPGGGFADVAAHYHLSVYYINALSADTLSAMPSVHVGWAVVVGVAPVIYGGGRWRWAALSYPVLTTYVVVATGNHWWMDGAVAIAVLALVVAAYWAVVRARGALTRHRRVITTSAQRPVPVATGPRI